MILQGRLDVPSPPTLTLPSSGRKNPPPSPSPSSQGGRGMKLLSRGEGTNPRYEMMAGRGRPMAERAVRSRANYGIDAPGVVRNLALFGVGALLAGSVAKLALGSIAPTSANWLLSWGVVVGAVLLGEVALMLYSSKVGKHRLWKGILDALQLRGNEAVLDVGCGRGAVLVAVARRLSSGKAVGVDIWKQEDQSGNSLQVTQANAEAEGVSDRIEIRDGDARHLPFEDASFDLVVSSFVIHNIYNRQGREQAVREIARVVKPGGRVALVDFGHHREYMSALRAAALSQVACSRLRFSVFPPGRVLTAAKPSV